MKIELLLKSLLVACAVSFSCAVYATDITATGSGDWESTLPDAPWPNGIVPGTNDSADVEDPFVVTVRSNAAAAYVYGSGTVVMAANSLLNIGDTNGANGTFELANLDTSAPGNTVLYSNNPFWAKHQNYFNLVFSNTVTTNSIDFFSGFVNSEDPAAAMTVAGDMTVVGKIKVQQGADFTVLGNLVLGTNSSWDCSSFNLTVASNTTIGGLMLDLDGASGSNYFGGGVLVSSNAIGWNVSDVTQWGIGGSLTNQGLIVGKGYGSITFSGTGSIVGKPIKIPTIGVSGTYLIGTTITLITNTPTLTGTLVFDLANTNQIVMQTYATNPMTLYYAGKLNVINSGPLPAAGTTYKFFSATNYNGAFDTTSYPPLSPGLNWIDNLLTSGSITVSGSAPQSIVISSPQYNPATHQYTLTWTSTPAATYSVQYSSDLVTDPFANNVLASGIPSGGTVTTTTVTLPANKTGFLRISTP
ncbi:MAG TPA: hypothetical protein VH597_06485 [Verrucomicrobiae bacterium]|jgi:hypothetical protein|nr:hypothetical protein [Verrucomicrobiae bacterium]